MIETKNITTEETAGMTMLIGVNGIATTISIKSITAEAMIIIARQQSEAVTGMRDLVIKMTATKVSHMLMTVGMNTPIFML